MKRILPIAVLVSLALATPARAGTYQVHGCDGPDGSARGMAPWRPFDIPHPSMHHEESCQTAADLALFGWEPGALVPGYQRGGWRLDAPAGTTIAELLWRGGASGISHTGVRVEVATGDDGATVWDSGIDFGIDLRRFALPSGARTLVVRQACRQVLCEIGTQPARTTTLAVWATLDDAVAPTAGGFAGTLTGPGALHGTAGLTFGAADVGSGVRRAALVVDGVSRWVPVDSCAPLPGSTRAYDSPSPCPPAAPADLSFATAGVQDGPHTVSATVEDAAGNVSTVFGPVTVTTDNAPPSPGSVRVTSAGTTLTATPSGFAGQDATYAYRWQRCEPECSDIDGATRARYTAGAGETVRAVIAATDLGGTTTAHSAPVTLDRAAPAPAPGAAPAAPAPAAPACACPRVMLAQRTISLAYGKRAEISGRVAGLDGSPVGGATLDVSARIRVPGAVASWVGGVGSARDGRFTYVAPAGPSRDVTIGGRTVTLLVIASGTFKAKRQGSRVRFSGRLRGGHIPAGGVLVEIRGSKGAVAVATANRSGVYRVTTKATRQTFRARARKESSWPFVGAPVGSPVSA
ncbi:hypothetical protein [Solirubrobacter soli]|uniref:hypothetical protein n=1 Tax=Solirubrobacter soli TaxID=363832 RepID=UPI000482B73A|nr:hypothetical protein [Solirubrobacter soli]